MRKKFLRLAAKLFTLALLVGCLSVVAPSRAAEAGWFDCLTDWASCMSQCNTPSPDFEGCCNDCDMSLMYCQASMSFDDGGFKIWP